MSKFSLISENTFKEMQLGAGILMQTFDPVLATVSASSILMATSGGLKFDAKPTYKDMGEDVDNCPKNMAELKQLEYWDVKMAGTAVTITAANAKSLMAAADVSGEKITPRNNLESADFTDLWWVGDYSDKNDPSNGGFVAIHMMKSLSTGGFSLQSGDKEKGQFPFEYMAHYTLAEQTKVPFEVYVKAGGV